MFLQAHRRRHGIDNDRVERELRGTVGFFSIFRPPVDLRGMPVHARYGAEAVQEESADMLP